MINLLNVELYEEVGQEQKKPLKIVKDGNRINAT